MAVTCVIGGTLSYLVNYPDTPLIQDHPCTLAGWGRSDNATVLQAHIGVYTSVNSVDLIALTWRGDLAGDPISGLYTTTGASLDTTTGYSVNTWHHGCFVCAAADDRRIYIDGGSKATASDSRSLGQAMNTTSIGRAQDASPGWHFSGNVAEAAMWNAALTDEEVAILALGYSPLFVRPQNLVSYYNLFGNSQDQIDQVGGVDLTRTNNPGKYAHPPIIYPRSPLFIPGVAAAAAPSYQPRPGAVMLDGVAIV